MPSPPSTILVVPAKRSFANGDRPSGLRVSVTAGPDAGRSLAIEGPRVIIGRGESADVRLTDPTVSQFHLELSLTSNGICVMDLNSTNGVTIGAVQVTCGTIQPDTAISLGASTIVVEHLVSQASTSSTETAFGGLVGQSAVMRELYALLARLARNDLSVVIQGETGTGKEAVARVLQERSTRSGGPFIVLDCSALPASLATSILFGHEKGAFTGATERRQGVFESANNGILFIDEVGELPLELQPLLLRVLESREVVPVGSTKPRKVNVRVISATWRDLRTMVNRGTFREDLYYRLAQATVYMPSLAERSSDIPFLVQHFLSRIPAETPAARSINADALGVLMSRMFPGNVRELRNTVERLALLADGPVVTATDMSFERMLAAVRTRAPQALVPSAAASGEDIASIEPFKEAKRTVVDEFERTYLARLLERAQRNLTRAALLAGVERHNLRELLKKHGLYAAKD